jgi:hypothetical protein
MSKNIDFSQIEVYKGKSFDELLKQIHDNSNEKSDQIRSLILKLSGFIKDTDDAALLVPLLASYLEVGVKNDEQLIKLAALVQRFIKTSASNNEEDSSYGLSEKERAEIIANAREFGSGKIVKMGNGN